MASPTESPQPAVHEDDVLAALKALDTAPEAEREDAGTDLCRAADKFRSTDETVSAATVTKLLRHANGDARLAGAMLVESTDAPPVKLILDVAQQDTDHRVREELVPLLPLLGEEGAALATDLVLHDATENGNVVDALVETGRIAQLLSHELSVDVLQRIARALERAFSDDSDQHRALATSLTPSFARLVESLSSVKETDELNAKSGFLWALLRVGQSDRVTAMAVDGSLSATTRRVALDALVTSDDHWTTGLDVATRLLRTDEPNVSVRRHAVLSLLTVARRDESDCAAIRATLAAVVAKDPNADVRDDARSTLKTIADW